MILSSGAQVVVLAPFLVVEQRLALYQLVVCSLSAEPKQTELTPFFYPEVARGQFPSAPGTWFGLVA